MDQVLLPTTWAYPDKTILQIIQARTRQQPQQPKNATNSWKLLESVIQRPLHIYTIHEASPNLSILQTALEKTDLAWIFASAVVVKGYGPEKLGKSWEACYTDVGDIWKGPTSIGERGRCQECQNASQTCAAEIYCQDSSNPNSRAVVKSLTRFTRFHLKQSCSCRACTLKTAILALQFNASSIWVTIWFDCASYFGWSRPVHAKPALRGDEDQRAIPWPDGGCSEWSSENWWGRRYLEQGSKSGQSSSQCLEGARRQGARYRGGG